MTPDLPERVLLIEDSETDALFVTEILHEPPWGDHVQVTVVETLADGVVRLADQGFDLVLLDLGLPDSTGLGTLQTLRAADLTTPVVVLTGLPDEALGHAAIECGAQDFLPKPEMTGMLLRRIARYALQRRRLQNEVQRLAEIAARVAELGEVERLATSRPAGGETHVAPERLSVLMPEAYRASVQRYGQVLDQRIEEEIKKVPATSTRMMQELSEHLGHLRCGPRDAVDLHLEAIQARMIAGTEAKAKAYMQAGRIALLELMGMLVAFYRPWYGRGNVKP